MKTDRELLGLAAKAAGLDLWTDEYDNLFLPDPMRRWNPLTDDGDALRLAVKLGMRVCIDIRAGFSWIKGYEGSAPHDGDPEAATRRAIVRAAAAIQEAKEAP